MTDTERESMEGQAYRIDLIVASYLEYPALEGKLRGALNALWEQAHREGMEEAAKVVDALHPDDLVDSAAAIREKIKESDSGTSSKD